MAGNNAKKLAPRAAKNETRSTSVERPPVVVIMGHVDHGKTSLLDYIRKARVAAREAGGITQHVGAYVVRHQSSDAGNQMSDVREMKEITFIDTPGHEAFSKIRERGAKLADIAVLVIAAEEGLKPQTREALKLIQDSKMPFVIALNKIDLPNANQDRVKQQLAELEVYVEDWGGKIPCLGISAKTGQGINELLEMILLMAEMEELKASPEAEPKGVIIESSLEPQEGVTATAIILDGKISLGQTIYTETAEAKIKSLENFLGERVKSLSFSSPAVITGWDKQPLVGETFSTQPSDSVQNKPEAPVPQEISADAITPASTENSGMVNSPAGGEKTFSLVLKADVAGSLEALEAIVNQLFVETEIKPIIQEKSAGPINLANLKIAESTGSVVISFRSKMNLDVKNYAKDRKIKIFESGIIYELQEKLKKLLVETQKPDEEKISGQLEILEIFSEKDKKNHQVVGGRLFEGRVKKNQRFSFKKTDGQVFDGKVLSIKKGKQAMESAEAVNEIGLQIETSGAVEKGDNFEFREK